MPAANMPAGLLLFVAQVSQALFIQFRWDSICPQHMSCFLFDALLIPLPVSSENLIQNKASTILSWECAQIYNYRG